jgi:formyltetrahydrofolate-dependent phosphoribosylglycinamide formyltransferase
MSDGRRSLVVAVLVSGSGSNLQALIDRFGDPASAVEVGLVVASRPGIRALDRAVSAGIRSVVLPTDPIEAEATLEAALADAAPDLVVLAGYLRLIPASLVERWRGRMLNVHPALLPLFGGPGMYGRRVHEAVLEAGVSETGVTVHLVDETYDGGPIVAQRRVEVCDGDDVDILAARVLAIEHVLLPDVVAAISDGTCRLEAGGARWTVPLSNYGEN